MKTHFKKLSVVIPCYNEKNTIEEIVDRVVLANSCGLTKEIIIVCDGSTDGSRKVLEKMRKMRGINIYFHKHNLGKGGALKTGFANCTGDIVLIQDADLEYDPDDYPLLLEPILSNNADVVYGSRFLGGRPHRVVYYWHSVMNAFLTMLSNMLTNINLTDIETCYKVMRGDVVQEIADKLESNGFGIEPEITARLAKIKNIRFYEVGISYYGRTYAEGKHITGRDGLMAIYEIFKYNIFS